MNVEPFSRKRGMSHFDCGVDELNLWLKNFAGQNERRGLSRTYLAVPEGSDTVAGYYAIVSSEVTAENAAGMDRREAGGFAVPAMLLARLATDRHYQGSGVGTQMLVHCLKLVVTLSTIAGVQVLIVRATSETAAGFYRRSGFEPFGDSPLHYYLPVKTIRATLGL